MSEAPRIAFSLGDTAGIGPEICLRVLSQGGLGCTPVLYAESAFLREEMARYGLDDSLLHPIQYAAQALEDRLNVIQAWAGESLHLAGKPNEASGQQAYLSLSRAAKDLVEGQVEALVTAPIDKQNIQNEDFQFPGHTEYLAQLSKTEDYLMLLVSGSLRVGVVTGHIPVESIARELSSEKILRKLRVIQQSLIQDFGIAKPRIAVLGLNPHAGDQGLIGTQEQTIIGPAIDQALEQGIDARGPFPADGLFGSGRYQEFDAILGMYHDQGLVPFKALSFGSGVNFTAGLAILRCSPDHGTAYDIAGQGTADTSSFQEAIELAIAIAQRRAL